MQKYLVEFEAGSGHGSGRSKKQDQVKKNPDPEERKKWQKITSIITTVHTVTSKLFKFEVSKFPIKAVPQTDNPRCYQGCGSFFADPDQAVFLNADPDPALSNFVSE